MSTEDALSRLTRYESLFELSSEINAASEIARVGDVMAGRLKYVADVFSWRYLSIGHERIDSSSREGNAITIDGYRGTATVSHVLPDHLSRVETRLLAARKTCFLTGALLAEAKEDLPDQFQKNDIMQLFVYPHFRAGELQALSIFSRRRQALSELDIKFITLAAQFFHEKIYMLWEQRKLRDLEQAYLQQEIMMRQSEKLATLGRLSAGMAHELNNPASAALSSSAQMHLVFDRLLRSSIDISAAEFSVDQASELDALVTLIRSKSDSADSIDAITRSDRENDLEMWLEDAGVEDAWEYAPTLVQLGLEETTFQTLSEAFTPEQLKLVVSWLVGAISISELIQVIGEGVGRISGIVGALKNYSYLDQAPVQNVDIHEGLNNTLLMLNNRLKNGVTVHRNYAEALPLVEAYGSELNQVWTNIIDNAISAMNGQGEITLTTFQDNGWVVVELADNGPGIPADIQTRIFDPFFTTKPPGEGTGLGLNISHNIIVEKHHGEISVTSQPGFTCFQVKLPLSHDNI